MKPQANFQATAGVKTGTNLPTKNNSTTTFMKEVSDVATQITKSVREGSAQAIEAAAPALVKANNFIHEATGAAGPKLSEATDRLNLVADKVRTQPAPRLQDLSPRLQELSDRGRAQAGVASERLGVASERLNKYGTKVAADAASRVADSSTKVAGLLATATAPKGVEEFVTRVTGDKKALKKAQKVAAKRAKAFAKQAQKSSKGLAPKESRPAVWTWVIWVLALGAIGGIAYFVWKKAQPVDDPWSQPLPGNRPADARPVGSHDDAEDGTTSPVVEQVEVPAGKAEVAATEGIHGATSAGATAEADATATTDAADDDAPEVTEAKAIPGDAKH